MLALQQYGSSDEETPNDDNKPQEEATTHLLPISPETTEFSVKSSLQICAAPLVLPTVL